MKDFIRVVTFTYPHEYAVLRNLLDQENIQYYFENETSIGVVPFYSNALGGIHLNVHPKDRQRVLQIIDQLDRNADLRIV